MMEAIQDLSMETGEMQVVLSALRRVRVRIREVSETHRPLFGGEHFLTGKEVCERLYISPRTLQDYRDRKIIPYTQFASKFSTRLRTWKKSWRRITKGEAPYEQPSKRIEDSVNNMQYQHVTSDR